MSEVSVKTTKRRFPIVFILLIVGGLLLGAGAMYYFMQAKKPENELKQIVAKVDNLIELPSDEEPTLATISDQEKLKNQSFFANAQNGDKVLIYAKAGKAILYRPSTNKIVEVAPINLDNGDTDEKTEPEPSPSDSAKIPNEVKVVLYNGTKTIGLTASASADLTADRSDVDVIDRDDASKKDYKESIVVNLTSIDNSLVEEIAKVLGAKIDSLPEDEEEPEEGDLLIIIGQDYLE